MNSDNVKLFGERQKVMDNIGIVQKIGFIGDSHDGQIDVCRLVAMVI